MGAGQNAADTLVPLLYVGEEAVEALVETKRGATSSRTLDILTAAT